MAMDGATGPEQQQQEEQQHKPDLDANVAEEGHGHGHGHGHGQEPEQEPDAEEEEEEEEDDDENVESKSAMIYVYPSYLLSNNNWHGTWHTYDRDEGFQDRERTLNRVLDVLASAPVHIALGMGIAFVMYQVCNMVSAK
jgi:hypothetical protein